MTTPPNPEDRLHVEVLKLLLQVAWSDGEMAPEEAHLLLLAADRWQVPVEDRKELGRCLEAGERLPAPDLGLLRTHAEMVLKMARVLIASDSKVQASEVELLGQLQELLGPPPG